MPRRRHTHGSPRRARDLTIRTRSSERCTRNSERRTRNSERRSADICDVTLNDFADCKAKLGIGGSSSSSRRIKKGNVTTAMKKLTVVSANDERPWDERDDDEEEEHFVICNGDGERGGALHTKRDHKRRRRRVPGKIEEEEEEEGTDYPLDLWFLISEYIRPEDVGRFASLCQATYYITTTARFWLALFRRNYRWSSTLPESLNYWNIDHRINNVRLCVVRALFHMYEPFCARLAAEKPLSADPTQLLRSQCVLQWHWKSRSHHKYFFKFAHPQHLDSRNGRLWKNVGDASAYFNPDNGCWVLEATSANAYAVPMVMGDYLYHAGVGVSANLCSHTLRLSLVPAHLLPPSINAPTRRHRVPATEITLDPVSNVRLYPWWHPEYWNLLQTTEENDKDDW